MKRALVSFAVVLFCSLSNAQNDFHFADSTATWDVRVHYLIGGPGIQNPYYGCAIYNDYKVIKDTFFNNLYYQEINRFIETAFFRKDSSGKVFLYDKGIETERMIYDFGLVKADTVALFIPNQTSNGTVKLVVDSTDTVFYGIQRKRIFLRCVSASGHNCSPEEDVWIEGIGSLNSFFLKPYYHEFTTPIYFDLSFFRENGGAYDFSKNCFVGMQETKTPTVLTVFPNPATTYLNIYPNSLQQQLHSVRLYSTTGKEMIMLNATKQTALLNIQELPSGIYFCHIVFDDGSTAVRKVSIE